MRRHCFARLRAYYFRFSLSTSAVGSVPACVPVASERAPGIFEAMCLMHAAVAEGAEVFDHAWSRNVSGLNELYGLEFHGVPRELEGLLLRRTTSSRQGRFLSRSSRSPSVCWCSDSRQESVMRLRTRMVQSLV